MATLRADYRVPAILTPEVYGGYIQGLAVYNANGTSVVIVGSTTITVDGSIFTFTSKSLSVLAAEIGRALPDVSVSSGIDAVPLADDLVVYVGDTTPSGGVVVRFKGMVAALTERTRIRVLKPHSETWHAAWWARINRGTFRTTIAGIQYTFSIPEYASQPWSPRFGRPYMEHIQALCKVRSANAVELPRGPVLGERGVTVLYQNGTKLNTTVISDVDENNRIVYLNNDLNIGDRITADYVYREDSYIYRGINLNPSLQHAPYLVDQFVLFYLLPWKSSTGSKITTTVNHVVGTSIESCIGLLPDYLELPIVVLGAIRTRQIEEANDVNVQDARTQGGGVIDDLDAESIEPEGMFYGDIGSVDGRGYPGNSVIISRIPKSVLDTFAHDEIMEIVRKHVALGTVTLVDYVS